MVDDSDPKPDSRSLCVAEFGSFHLNPRIPRPRLVSDLGTDVFALSITIRPDKQCLAVSGLVANVLCNWQLILWWD